MYELLSLTVLGGLCQASALKPHIVFIVADDLGYGDLGYTGKSEIKTPAFDYLAANGRVLQSYYVQPSCAPTRATIHTGRYCMRYGIDFAGQIRGPHGLALNETLLPQ